MENKKRKKELIESNKHKEFGELKYKLYYENRGDIEAVEEQLKQIYKDDYINLKQILEARKKQNKKIKEHLNYLINQNKYDIYFGTFTYDDAKRKKTMNPKTLKKYVIRAIDKSEDYIINIDYGSQNERLHYHALIAYQKDHDIENDEAIKIYKDKVGFVLLKKIKTEQKDIEALSRYITKLTLHSLKVKQNYVSTKKNTQYQHYKSEYERQRKQGLKGYSYYVEQYRRDIEEPKPKS